MTTHAMIPVDGKIEVKKIHGMPLSRERILSYLGVAGLGPMDVYDQRGPDVVIVEIAQERAWTWVRHIFTA